jgi:hypothetical protein
VVGFSRREIAFDGTVRGCQIFRVTGSWPHAGRRPSK